jgi:hypothetical protein
LRLCDCRLAAKQRQQARDPEGCQRTAASEKKRATVH